jgi:hypothetical protein
MSASSDPGQGAAAIVAGLGRSADAALAAVDELMAHGATADVPDETAQRLLLAGVRLFAHKVDSEHRSFRPVPGASSVSATEVAVTVTELMRAAGLNMFDLAMWSGRARPHDET